MCAGFESQASFTRAFKKAFGLTPNEYRKFRRQELILKQFDSEYLEHINQNISLTPEVYAQKKMQLVGLKTNFYSVESKKMILAKNHLYFGIPLCLELVR